MSDRVVVRLTLVSASPRRQELVGRLGYPFDVCPSDAAERWHGRTAEALAIANAELKIKRSPYYGDRSRLLLGADTIIQLDDRVFGKPFGVESARCMLQSLSGRCHSVITGVALCGPSSTQGGPMSCVSSVAFSRVRFHDLSSKVTQDYLSTGDWMGKAGGYAIQSEGRHLVESVEGDFENVVGLPVELVSELVRQHFSHCHFL